MLEYMKHSLRGNRTSIAHTKLEFRKKYETVGQELAHPYADISLTTAKMDVKLILLERKTFSLSGDTKIARFI